MRRTTPLRLIPPYSNPARRFRHSQATEIGPLSSGIPLSGPLNHKTGASHGFRGSLTCRQLIVSGVPWYDWTNIFTPLRGGAAGGLAAFYRRVIQPYF